ncbi:unnamed protein product, partial [marine sediment metagenome]
IQERDLWLTTYHKILMEEREKTGYLDPSFYKILEMVEARLPEWARAIKKSEERSEKA